LIKDYQQDPVHPNLAGYRVMEEIIEKILKWERRVESLELREEPSAR
jgi:lysophospholipase L1-like esterase